MHSSSSHHKTLSKVPLISSPMASTKQAIISVAILITLFLPFNLGTECANIGVHRCKTNRDCISICAAQGYGGTAALCVPDPTRAGGRALGCCCVIDDKSSPHETTSPTRLGD